MGFHEIVNSAEVQRLREVLEAQEAEAESRFGWALSRSKFAIASLKEECRKRELLEERLAEAEGEMSQLQGQLQELRGRCLFLERELSLLKGKKPVLRRLFG